MFPSKILWDAVSQPFKRAQTGLFQGKKIQYGNNVPFSYKKTRRTWLPNVQNKRLPSEITGGMIRVKLTTRALRTIKKVFPSCYNASLSDALDFVQKGGLDNYLKTTSSELLGDAGMRLRMRLLETKHKTNYRQIETYKVQTPEELAAERRTNTLHTVRLNMPASLETARLARILAARALGQSSQPARFVFCFDSLDCAYSMIFF